MFQGSVVTLPRRTWYVPFAPHRKQYSRGSLLIPHFLRCLESKPHRVFFLIEFVVCVFIKFHLSRLVLAYSMYQVGGR
jgi:hypothetical protein